MGCLFIFICHLYQYSSKPSYSEDLVSLLRSGLAATAIPAGNFLEGLKILLYNHALHVNFTSISSLHGSLWSALITMIHVATLNSPLWVHYSKTSHTPPTDETEEEVTEEMLHRSKLSHFFMSLSLLTDETRLHAANLFVPGLPQQYSGSKLADILQVISY